MARVKVRIEPFITEFTHNCTDEKTFFDDIDYCELGAMCVDHVKILDAEYDEEEPEEGAEEGSEKEPE